MSSRTDIGFGVTLDVQMRNNGKIYAGVGNCTQTVGTNGLIPKLYSVGTNVVRLANLGTGASLGVGPGEVKEIKCQISNAGAAALPVNLRLCAAPPATTGN